MIAIRRGRAPAPIKKPLPRKGISMAQREARIGLIFLMPWIVGFLLFKMLPILAAFVMSFTNFYMLTPEATKFIGLANYITMLGDPAAGASMFGSIGYFLITVPVEMVAALALAAIFASDRMWLRRFMRTMFFMPSIIPATAVLFIWLGMANPSNGWINRLIMEPMGFPPIANPFSATGFNILLIVMALWSIGPGFLIMLGAIQSVPPELHEAARVDGAGPITRLVFVTIPMISPAIFFSLVINLTGVFGGSVLLDRGYLFNNSLSPMEGYINSVMFSDMNLGYACALAVLMFAVTMSITVALFRSSKYWVYFPEENRDEDF
jgi:multiple sugar transport system permease protein